MARDYSELNAMKARAGGATEAGVAKAAMTPLKKDGLTDMKITKAEQKQKDKVSPCCGPSGSGDRYPYGLELRLDNDVMEKLGIDLPTVGKEVTVTAKAMVTEASARDTQGDGKRLSCTLQLQKLKVG